MGKLLFWLVVLFGIGLYLYAAFKLKRRHPPAEKNPSLRTHETIRCAHCGAFVAREQAAQRAGQWYCSWAHADADTRRKSS
ncbi:PP0621 family protein [Halothiobacillus sp. DCM-1]|uniref:PP0621 family protein n=1 Tax=Halothiobacillus sp. DCM-1 TaxID=3112558 RepID=UPI00324E2EE7